MVQDKLLDRSNPWFVGNEIAGRYTFNDDSPLLEPIYHSLMRRHVSSHLMRRLLALSH